MTFKTIFGRTAFLAAALPDGDIGSQGSMR
jgi:hypothetical protein